MSEDPFQRNIPGAVFRRCALQVNPHRYGSNFRGEDLFGDEQAHARAIVERARELGITILAITDHNSVTGVEAFRSAAAGTSVHVLPGFEVESQEGVHVLCIYPPDTEQERLGRYLGQFGLHDPGSSSGLCSKTFPDLLACVREQGGVAVAAHATQEKGVLKTLKGKARARAWKSEDLLAVQIPGSVADLPVEYRRIVQNADPEYFREHAAGEGLAVAVVNASDVVTAEDLEKPTSTSMIKMSEVGIEGLRQAFLDPLSRIRLHSDLLEEDAAHAELVQISWQGGGFLDGAVLDLNPNLNILIGGRGTGKSTVMESIRAVLGLSPIGDEAGRAHESVLKHVLRSGTKITLHAITRRPATKAYIIERTLPNPPVVRELDGTLSNLLPSEVVRGVELYGQHEISELAASPERRTRLLERFGASDPDLTRRADQVVRDLQQNRRSLTETRLELTRLEERLAALPALEETLEQFNRAGLEERLREQSLLVREERIFGTARERIGGIKDALAEVRRELPVDRAFLSVRALEELPGKALLSRLDGILGALDHKLQATLGELDRHLEGADAATAAVRAEWETRRQAVQAEYERILRDLQKQRVDGEEFIRLRRQIEELRPLGERLTLLRTIEKEHTERRRALIAEWEELKGAEFRVLAQAAERVSKSLGNLVQVEVTYSGNKEPLFDLLREEIGGRLDVVIGRLKHTADLSVPQFVDACRGGADKLAARYGISGAQAERLVAVDAEILMRVEELKLLPTTEIQLNTAAADEPPVWQTLDKLSAGQRATAVLLLLLLRSEGPLIIDQPEDDLDNRFIADGIVPRIRDEKEKRQFIFSTHNANIPVLGDAELIVGLSASGDAEEGKAWIDGGQMGSIDSPTVQLLVEELLEGGKDAFERRRRKYGF